MQGKVGVMAKTVKLASGTLRYYEKGPANAPVALFIHGLLINSRLWDKVSDEVSTKYRCIMPDLPLGCHEEKLTVPCTVDNVVQLLHQFVTALNLTNFTLVGNDTGGALCQIYTTRYLNNSGIARLILTNCDSMEHFPPTLFKPFVWASYFPGIYYMVYWLFSFAWIFNALAPLVSIAKTKIDFVDKLYGPGLKNSWIRKDAINFLKSCDTKTTIEASKQFHKCTMPVKFVWAEEDFVFTTSHAQRLVKMFPNAKLINVKNSLFMVPIDRPDAVAAAILDDTDLFEKKE